MAAPGDALSALTRLIKFDKLEPLLGTGKSPTGVMPGSPSTNSPAGPGGANSPTDGAEPEQLTTGQRVAVTLAGVARSATPPTAAASAYTKLSADASLITQLLADTSATQGKRLPMTSIDVSTAPPEQVAKAFARSLVMSGMFYESHLHEWVAGDRPLTALQAEPHNRLPLMLARNVALANPADAAEHAAPTGTGGTTTQSTAGPNSAAVPELLAALVREQLDALDFRRVQWQGEVWPNQQAQLEIAEDDARREDDSESAQQQWRTTLRIDLPHLGQIEVRIALDPAGIGVSVQAADEAVAALQPGRAVFAAALQDAGIALRTVEVKANG